MDQLTKHARHYVLPLWISLLRMRDIMFCSDGSAYCACATLCFATMDQLNAHAGHYVLPRWISLMRLRDIMFFHDGSAYCACATLCFATMDQLTLHARHYVLPRWISLLRMRDIKFRNDGLAYCTCAQQIVLPCLAWRVWYLFYRFFKCLIKIRFCLISDLEMMPIRLDSDTEHWNCNLLLPRPP